MFQSTAPAFKPLGLMCPDASINKMTKQFKIFFLLILTATVLTGQPVNQVGNPSFETLLSCSGANFLKTAKYWNSLDSASLICGGALQNTCFFNVPITGYGFQNPKTGNGFTRQNFYCTSATCGYPYFRTYPKNRLLSTLTLGKVYCVKINLNIENISPLAIDGFGVYLGDVSLDTIKYCGLPLTFLTPQIQNTPGNVIGDTLNWIEVSGTFTATGIEKYLVIGNFNTDAATTTTATSSTFGGVFGEYFLDDVSVIDYNLPAFAGPDKNLNLGDSAFIGRPPEIGLECNWTSGTVTIGNGGGLWVKPPTIGTYSYIVTQNICGNIKKDTVNVNVSPSGVSETELFSKSISLYPQPAKDLLTISLNYFYDNNIEVKILDLNGKEIESKELTVNTGKAQLVLNNISDGVYIIKIKNSLSQVSTKRLVINR